MDLYFFFFLLISDRKEGKKKKKKKKETYMENNDKIPNYMYVTNHVCMYRLQK